MTMQWLCNADKSSHNPRLRFWLLDKKWNPFINPTMSWNHPIWKITLLLLGLQNIMADASFFVGVIGNHSFTVLPSWWPILINAPKRGASYINIVCSLLIWWRQHHLNSHVSFSCVSFKVLFGQHLPHVPAQHKLTNVNINL